MKVKRTMIAGQLPLYPMLDDRMESALIGGKIFAACGFNGIVKL